MWIECYDYLTANRWFFWPILWGLPFCTLGLYLLIAARKTTENRGCALVFMSAWTGFAFFWTIGVGYDVVSEHQRYKTIIANRQYREIEGPVEHFGRSYDKRWGIYRDTFWVNQVRFTMEDKDLHKMPAIMDSSGQALADGRWVKVQYVRPVLSATDVSEEALEERRWVKSADYHPVILKMWVKGNGE